MQTKKQQNCLHVASIHFQNGNTQESIIIYTKIINGDLILGEQKQLEAFLNRATAYYTECKYQESLKDVETYIKKTKQLQDQPKPEGFIVYCNCLIKMKKILSQQEKKIIQEGKTLFPYHKKLNQVRKTLNQIQITEDQDQYMDKMFQKLLIYPQIRQYLTDQSFLTKVQKLIRNPSLASTLVKLDKRLQQVTQALLMADQ